MGLGLLILLVAAAAGALYWWQKNLLKQSAALFKKANQASADEQLPAAEEACLHAVAFARLAWMGREDLLVVALHQLAHVYFQQGKLEQAEQTAVKAFAAMRKLRRPSPIGIPLVCLLAQIYKKLHKDQAAHTVFQVAIQLLRKVHGDRSMEVGVALHELGVTLSRVGVPERAIGVLEECIPIFEEHRGQNHSDVAAALINLGKAQSQVERFADAERSYRRALAIRETSLGPDDPEVALVLNNLAVNYKRQNRIPEALECLRRSLSIREAKLGPDHPNVALVLNNLGNCLRLERKYAEAEAVLTRAMTILGTPGQESSYATAVDSLAGLRAAQGRYEEAEQLYIQCLKILESLPSSNLLELAETCERFADVLYKLQKETQADAMIEQVTKLRSAREKLRLDSVAS
jgi:tetratricopeptide (TPR) repeat protein